MIVVHDHELTERELSILSLIDPNITVNVIEDDMVTKKGRVNPPSVLDNVLQCQNKKCVSWPDHDEHVPSKFYIEEVNPLKARCHYCENPMDKDKVHEALIAPLSSKIVDSIRYGGRI